MKIDDAKEVLRLITKVLSNPRLRSDDGDQLRKAQREIEAMARSGNIERRKLFRAVRIICQILLGLL
jgi:hypothetical protein